MSVNSYYYNKQLKKFITGFANVFVGLHVTAGLDACGEPTMMEVPIRYGSSDRVVAALGADNTQNKQFNLPVMSCYMTGLEMNPDRLHGVNTVDTRKFMEQGGVFPTDLKAIKRVMPIPYDMQMELSIYASNSDQMYQILEQILIMFNYDLQLQFNDAMFDWTKITKINLLGISNEENYPMGVDRRAIVWTFQMSMPIWLSPPLEIRREIISAIQIRLGNIETLTLDEVDAEGNLVPFSEVYSQTTVTAPQVTPSVPPTNRTHDSGYLDPGLEDCKC